MKKWQLILGLTVLMLVCGWQRASYAAKATEITFAIHTPPGTVENQALQMFKDKVEAGTNGEIVVKLFPGAALGGEKDNIEQIKTGVIQMSIFGDMLTSVYAPEYDPTVVPFVFPDLESVYEYWSGDLGDKIKLALEQRGNIVLIGLHTRGPRNLTANKEVKTPGDLKGLKIRVAEIPSWVTVWKSMSALPTPIAWPEVYTALQLGVVDAQENPYENIYSAKLYEVQKYLMKTEHLFNLYHVVVNKEFISNLKSDHRQVLLNSMDEAMKWGNAQMETRDKELEQKLTELGMKIVEVDKEAFRRAALPGLKEVAKGWAPEVWDSVKGYLGE